MDVVQGSPRRARRGVKLDADVLTVLLEESAFELGPVVRDDAVRDAKSAHNGFEEYDC